MRPIMLSVALLVLSGAFNLTVNKYGGNVPDWLIIACWLLPLIPLVYWTLTHPKLVPHRQWYKERFRARGLTTIVATIAVVVILTVSLGSAGYRGWKALTKKNTENLAKQSPTAPQVSPNKTPKEPVPSETPTVEPKPPAKTQKHQPTVKSNPKPLLPAQNCPNGNCIGGDNNGTAIVNNGPPEPNVEFIPSKTVETPDRRFATVVGIIGDQDIKDFTFRLEFDNTVNSPEVNLSYSGGVAFDASLKTSPGSSNPGNVFEATIRAPTIFPKGARVAVTVYSYGPINFVRGIRF